MAGRGGPLDGGHSIAAQMKEKGPIPEGKWSVNSREVQTPSFLDEVVSGFGRGTWPGGWASWGSQRYSLSPDPMTDVRGRDPHAFFIHGGRVFGSAGCIGLCSNANAFFGTIDQTVGYTPVYIDYP